METEGERELHVVLINTAAAVDVALVTTAIKTARRKLNVALVTTAFLTGDTRRERERKLHVVLTTTALLTGHTWRKREKAKCSLDYYSLPYRRYMDKERESCMWP